MFIRSEKDVLPVDLTQEEGVKGVDLRPLITKQDGAKNFTMRLFRLDPEGHTPFHGHAWEHEVFVVRGSGKVEGAEGSLVLEEGMAVYVPPHEKHRFHAGRHGMTFLCCIPNQPE